MRRAIREYLLTVVAIAGLMALAGGVAGYILTQQRLRLPFVQEEPFRIEIELEDAQAVTPGQGQTVQVAGVKVGDIGKLRLEEGRAIVTLELLPEHEGLVRADATALLRSRTGLKDMLLEIAPGRGRPLREGERISAEGTAPDVDLDEILAVVDGDTRAYLQLLINGAGQGLRGRGRDVGEALRRLGPLHRDVARVTGAMARRRRGLRRLVTRYGSLSTELGRSDRDLVRLVRATDATFQAVASRRQDLSRAVALLPGTLRESQATLDRVAALSRELPPTVQALRPAVRRLGPVSRAALPLVREATPILRDRIRPLVRIAGPEVASLAAAGRNLNEAGPQLTKGFRRFNRLLDMLAYNPRGREGMAGRSFDEQRSRQEGYLYWLAWTAQAGTSAFAHADGQGVFRRFFFAGTNCSVFVSSGLPGPIADLLGDAGLCHKVIGP